MEAHIYVYNNKLWTPSLTVADENSFFHAAYGTRVNETEPYSYEATRAERKLWSAFLSHFESNPIPSSLATVLENIFSANNKYSGASFENKHNLAEYADGIIFACQNVFLEEIPILATLNNTKIVIFKDQENDPLEINPNHQMLGTFGSFNCSKKKEAVLLLKDNVFKKLDSVTDPINLHPDCSSTTYERGGDAGSKSFGFHIDVLAIISLNAYRNLSEWQLSAINKKAGEFGDVVLESPDGATLLRAKHKEDVMQKITKDDLLSGDPKRDEFSLVKYFLSYYQNTKKNFPKIKNVILCTNRNFDCDNLESLIDQKICSESVLYHKSSYRYFTFRKEMLPILKEGIRCYLINLKDANAEAIITDITDGNIEDFLEHFQLCPNYPEGHDIRMLIEGLLNQHTRGQTYSDLCDKIKKWFRLKKSSYLGRSLADVMLLEIQRDKYCKTLDNYHVNFKDNSLIDQMKEKSAKLYVIDGSEYLLRQLRIYDALKDEKEKLLFINFDDKPEIQKQVVEVFALPQYTCLIITWPKITEAAIDMCNKLKCILADRDYKKVILLSEDKYEFISQIEVSEDSYTIITGSVALKDLSRESRTRLFEKKNITFQGRDTSMKELFKTEVAEEYDKGLNSELLEKLVKNDKITVGVPLLGLDEHITQYYIDRRFKTKIMENETINKSLSGIEMFDENEKVILISDMAGMGKSTVLTKLAVQIKEKNPDLWVVRIELNDCTAILNKFQENTNEILTVMKLMSREDTNHLENYVFSLQKKIVLMLDGLDEVSPNYTELVINMLSKCEKASNFAKIVVTTRPHMTKLLEMQLKAKTFMLQPFTQMDQTKFLTCYWMHNLRVDMDSDVQKGKCERYAKILINRMSTWLNVHHYTKCTFTEVPLQAKMLAEVFKESNPIHSESLTLKKQFTRYVNSALNIFKEKNERQTSSNWGGCREYLSTEENDSRLPEKMNIMRLYRMFISHKLHIFMNKANPTKNVYSSNILNKELKECLSYHQSLALKLIFGEFQCKLFQSYRDIGEKEKDTLLSIGIVQEVNNELHFVHRTFAEYFATQILVEELLLTNEDVLHALEHIVVNRNFNMVRVFFDNFLADNNNIFQDFWFRVNSSLASGRKYEFRLIHILAEEGCVELLRFLYQYTYFKDVAITVFNAEDETHRTPLYYAAKYNHLAMVQFLIEQGADVNLHRRVHRSPLVAALRAGHLEVVQFLVEKKAKITLKDYANYYILYDAVIRKHVKIADYLLSHIRQRKGLKLNITIAYTAAYLGQLDTLKLMIKTGLDISDRTQNGETLIFGATRGAQLDIINYLKKKKCDINVLDNFGNTVLHVASIDPSLVGTVQLLIESGINLNKQNDFGRTALHNAVRCGNFDVAELLIRNKANIDSMDKSGDTPLVVSSDQRSDHIYLRDDDGRTLLHAFAECGELELIKSLEELGMNLDVRDNDGRTPLYVATLCGNMKIVEFLVECGANVNIGDESGRFPLHLLALGGRLNMVVLLVKHGAHIHDRNNFGNTPLHEAAKGGNFETVKFLLEKGLFVDDQDKDYQTPLHYAASEGHFDVVRLLLEHGANRNIKNSKQKTALNLARNRDIVELLQEGHND